MFDLHALGSQAENKCCEVFSVANHHGFRGFIMPDALMSWLMHVQAVAGLIQMNLRAHKDPHKASAHN